MSTPPDTASSVLTPGRALLLLLSGSALGQLAILLSAPIVSRLYSPGDVGLYATWLAGVTIFSAVLSLRWELALPQVEEGERTGLSMLALTTSIALGAALATGTAIYGYLWEGADLEWYLLPAGAFLLSVLQIFLQTAVVRGLVRRVSFARGSQGGAQAIFQVGGGWHPTPTGLIFAHLASFGLALLLLRRVRPPLPISRRWWRTMVVTARERWRVPFWSGCSAFLNVVGTQVPLLFLVHYGTSVVGQYSMGVRATQAPVILIGTAVGQVLIHQIAIRTPLGHLRATILGFYRQGAMIMVSTWLMVAVAGDAIAVVLLGEEWSTAGRMLQILSPGICMMSFAVILTAIPTAMGFQGGEFKYQLALFALRLSFMAVGALASGAMGVVIGYSTASAIAWFLYLRWVFALLNLQWRSWTRSIIAGNTRMYLCIGGLGITLASLRAALDLTSIVVFVLALFIMVPSLLSAGIRARKIPDVH